MQDATIKTKQPLRYDKLLEGKRALVTGGAQGIGREIALLFAQHGAAVAIADIVEDKGRETEALLRQYDPRCFFMVVDTGVAGDVQRFCEAVQQRFGGVDIVDNNVGINIREQIDEIDEEHFERVWSVNLRGALMLCKYFLPGMVAAGGGSILFTSTIHAVASVQAFASYASSKGAINAVARVLAIEHARDNIRVNVIMPGGVRSSLVQPFYDRLSEQDRKRSMWSIFNPLPTSGQVDDISNAHLFFASGMSSYITGNALLVDGGSAVQLHAVKAFRYPHTYPVSKRLEYFARDRAFRQNGGSQMAQTVYQELGVKTYINAWDTMSLIGGSRMEQPTLDAMREASHDFVELAQLEEKVGKELAALTHNEAAYVTCGASAGILISSAVCMAGGANRDKLKQLPDTTGLKNEIIIMKGHRNSYDFAVKASGGTLVEVGTEQATTEEELEAAFNDKTAAVLFADIVYFAEHGLPLETVVKIAHKHGAYVIVDGAAQLPPKENLWYYTRDCGADLALFSGGKGLRGPQQGGLVVGKKALIDAFFLIAPPNQGIGRSSKLGREEIVGVYTVVKQFLKDGVVEQRQKYIEDSCDYIMAELEKTGLFHCTKLWPGPTGQSYYWVEAHLTADISAEDLVTALKDDEPGVRVGHRRGKNSITVNPLNLEPSEIDIVIDQIVKHATNLQKKG